MVAYHLPRRLHRTELDDIDDELECRICRGPAEEERPLFRPCKCSGSIALTHQDCLVSWLEVKRGYGKCDLCGHKFSFAPKYANDAPEHLSTLEVLTGLALRAGSNWIPFMLRFFLIAATWLGILPLLAAHIYQAWMHKPSSNIPRMKWSLISSDLVNGAILTLVILFSFLSLISLGDFFRLNWQRNEVGDIGIDANRDEDVLIEEDNTSESDVSETHSSFSDSYDFEPKNRVLDFTSVMDEGQPYVRHEEQEENMRDAKFAAGRWNVHGDAIQENIIRDMNIIEDLNEGMAAVKRQRSFDLLHQRLPHGVDHTYDKKCEASTNTLNCSNHSAQMKTTGENNDDDISDGGEDDDSLLERMMQLQEDMMDTQGDEEVEEDHGLRRNQEPQFDNERFEPQFQPLERPFEDEEELPMDNEMQVPVDQLIGLRGPLSDVFRNLCWLFAFLTTFIAVFACIPRAIGSFAFYQLSRSKIMAAAMHFLLKTILFAMFKLSSDDGKPVDLVYLSNVMMKANEEQQNLLQPRDVGKILFGYISMAMGTFTIHAFVNIFRKYSKSNRDDQSHLVQNIPADDVGIHNMDDIRLGLGGAGNPMHGRAGRDHRDRMDPDAIIPEAMQAFIVEKLGAAVDCAASMAKISILVCFKMFVLPSLLGTWLDLSTLKLFNATIDSRASDAGADIIGFFLVHWVVGITFMLTVTVSVLQLREVLHPDLVAPVIRPQEPQPDLLINLLEESGFSHSKRILPSLGIYAALLAIHVWLPCKIMNLVGIDEYIPLFRPKFWYLFYGQLQRPFELLAFHLTVLSILEKYKNKIGEMQHIFLLKLSSFYGLVENILPKEISEYALVGEFPFECNGEGNVDEFWDRLIELEKKNGPADLFIESQMHLMKPTQKLRVKKQVVTPESFIVMRPGDDTSDRKLMPTRIGSYRFRKRIRRKGGLAIEVWREVVDAPIPRPPKGWDYLGDGGAVEQGRWAWTSKEKKSDIEHKVAQRTFFFPPVLSEGLFTNQWKTRDFWIKGIPVIVKIATMTILSWIAVSWIAASAIFTPLFLGRFVYHLLEIPDHYTHDPFLFVLGGAIMSPLVVFLANAICNNEDNALHSGTEKTEDLPKCKRNRSLPPLRKLFVLTQTILLWGFVCPMIAGTMYHCFFLAPISSLSFNNFIPKLKRYWPVGFMLFNFWATACFYGMFRKEFWSWVRSLLIEGIAGAGGDGNENMERQQEVNNDRDDAANDKRPEGHKHNRESQEWQGRDGAIGTFVETMSAVLIRKEWDKVDRATLLDDCLYPVTRQLIMLLLVPMCACYGITSIFFPSEHGRIYLYRFSTSLAITIHLALIFKSPLRMWYKAAHKAARDHRYLIGEILLNYQKQS